MKLNHPPHAHVQRVIERRDPLYGYDPKPLSRGDIHGLLVDLPAALICLIGLIAFLVILFTLVPGPM